MGVVSLQVTHRVELRCDGHGNCERERSAFTWRDRAGAVHEGAVVDVHLSVRAASATSPATCSATAPWL